MEYKYSEITNIPVFKYGIAENGVLFISEAAAKRAFKDYKSGSIPIIVGEKIIGFIHKIREFKDFVVYGDVIVFDLNFANVDSFINYEIIIGKSTVKDDIRYVENFKISSVFLANKAWYEMYRDHKVHMEKKGE